MISMQILLSKSQAEVKTLKFIEYLETLIWAYLCLSAHNFRPDVCGCAGDENTSGEGKRLLGLPEGLGA